MAAVMDQIAARFPDQQGQIERLCEQEEVFQDICEDYVACLQALAYWRESTEPYADRYAESYRTLQSRLELEIMRHLNQAQSKSQP